IYRVAGSVKLNGVLDEYAYSPALLADAMEAEIPEVENTVRLRGYGPRLLRKEGTIQNFRETRVMHVDASLFDIFTLPLIYGSKEEVLKSPNGIVLTQSTAEKYFGKANPVGESMILDNSESYRVDGVCVDIPSNAHFHFDVFLPTVGLEEFQNSIWLSNNAYTYFLAKPNSDREVIQSKIAAMYRKHADAQLKQYTGADFEEFEAAGNFIDFNLQPLKSIHLNSNLPGEHEPNGDKAYVWIFAGIALFILLIACINFMNLSTARSAHRAKEVGMRKVLGSKKGDLVGQFLMESILISSISFSLAILLGRLLLPAFNELTNKDLSIPFLNPIFLGTILVAIILIGILAGSYPAFFLSAFEPLKVLKGNMNRGVVSGRLRQFLVTSQFSISIVLMIGTGVIYNQLNFIQKKRLGFNKEQVMVFQPTGYQGDFDVLKNQIDALPEVKESTVGITCATGTSCNGQKTTNCTLFYLW
ncbi:MAG: ABC transporter permease, partial [Bacteroidota bacterium]